MKYLSGYKIFESSNKNYYYMSEKHWGHQLGYIWSPNSITINGRNDSDVTKVEIENDGMSNTLSNRTAFPLFKEHLGTSNLDELCEFYLEDYRPDNEFSFLKKGLIEKRCYVNIKVPGKSDIIQQVPDFEEDYLDLVGRITGHVFTDKERKDLEDGKDSKYYGGSWDINVGLYDVGGIRIISTDMDGFICYILKRSDIEKLLDMTQSYNYYRFEDKQDQLLRVGGNFLEYNDIKDIFLELSDIDNKITLVDFNQISKDQIMVKFKTTNAIFDKELVDILEDSISRFSSVYGFKFSRIDLTRNHMMYVNDINKWIRGRPVYSFEYLDNLFRNFSGDLGEIELYTVEHSMYIIFNI
jgi:hypothetical protein